MDERGRPAAGARCPGCGRPIALARASCLYCGRALPGELVPSPPAEPLGRGDADPVPPGEASGSKAILVVQLQGASASVLAAALDRTTLEAQQLVRRGGWSLLGARPAELADRVRDRLAEAGVRCLVLDGAAVSRAAVPWLAVGARFDGRLHLRGAGGARCVAPGDLLLVVAGAIRREYQARETRARSFRTATLEQGFRFHLHRRDDPVPIELDPAGLEFDEDCRPAASSLLRVGRWVSALSGAGATDEGFRFLPPALAPATPSPEAGVLAAAARLSSEASEEAVVLDNLAQFRFYSAWRACAERALADG